MYNFGKPEFILFVKIKEEITKHWFQITKSMKFKEKDIIE